MNTKIKIPDNPIDLINVLFTQLEITYHNQFHKAFPDSDSLKLAKQLWLKKLSLFENEIIFKSIDNIMSNSEYLPSLSSVLQKCKTLTLNANNIPSLEKAFKEASSYCDAPSEHNWSHPIVYHAGLETGWFFLQNESEQSALREFKNKFDFLINEWLEGKEFKSPDVPKLEKINSKLDKSQQLNFIENLKKNF